MRRRMWSLPTQLMISSWQVRLQCLHREVRLRRWSSYQAADRRIATKNRWVTDPSWCSPTILHGQGLQYFALTTEAPGSLREIFPSRLQWILHDTYRQQT